MQAFAYAHPEKQRGVIMVDPVTQVGWATADSAQMRRLQLGARLARRGAFLARLGIVRATLALLMHGGTKLPKLISRASAGQGDSVLARLTSEVRKLPPETHPVIAYHWSRARSFRALAAYLECLPESARTALEYAGSFRNFRWSFFPPPMPLQLNWRNEMPGPPPTATPRTNKSPAPVTGCNSTVQS